MRISAALLLAALFFSSCDDKSLYHEYADFKQRYWLSNDKPEFEFSIDTTTTSYDVFLNVRNSTSYPYSRLFINYTLIDSTGRELEKKLLGQFLFDAKTGEPLGKSGLGDLYDHEFMIMKNKSFQPGEYKVRVEQFMRTDTLEGILAVGLQVKKAEERIGK